MTHPGSAPEDRRALRALLREALEAASGDSEAALDWLRRRSAAMAQRQDPADGAVISVLLDEVVEDWLELEEWGIAALPACSQAWREAEIQAAGDAAKAEDGFVERIRTDPALLQELWAAMVEAGTRMFADARAAWERERQA